MLDLVAPGDKCTECKEYDTDKHYCPKWCDVIEKSIEDARTDEKAKVLKEVRKKYYDLEFGAFEAWLEKEYRHSNK